jgi:glutathione peroxidase
MFSKISVKGDDMHPLYEFLTSKAENGVIDAPVKWNFQKFLIGKDGRVITSIGNRTSVTERMW